MRAKQWLTIMHILFWIIFIGLCIEEGNLFLHLFFAWFNPAVIPGLLLAHEIDISSLLKEDRHRFLTLIHFMSVAVFFKAVLLCGMVLARYRNGVNFGVPFNVDQGRFLAEISYLCLFIGAVCRVSFRHTSRLVSEGINIHDSNYPGLAGGDVWLFTGVISW